MLKYLVEILAVGIGRGVATAKYVVQAPQPETAAEIAVVRFMSIFTPEGYTDKDLHTVRVQPLKIAD